MCLLFIDENRNAEGKNTQNIKGAKSEDGVIEG